MNQESSMVQTFDEKYSTAGIQKLKIIATQLSGQNSNLLAVYIILMQLKRALTILSHTSSGINRNMSKCSSHSFDEVMQELSCYCDKEELQHVKAVQSFIQQANELNETLSIIEELKSLYPEGFAQEDNLTNILQFIK